MPMTMPDVDRVIALIQSISGDRAKAVWWLSQPLATFGGKTALQLKRRRPHRRRDQLR
ncbi:DUF2384 domain-containing protein [Dyella tabacisoli]|uniref:DUF2384 domain-containing protein n=1 Tax=Dyella tabacisoli TaxID=2282381 RepID=A0A369USA3_9GAMM|nr:DUF2384 domain-containing protein [Dyella tabacisoli]